MDAEGFLKALDESMAAAIGREGRAAVAYSGGVDSALVAHFAAGHCDVVLYTCGTDGSPDLKEAGRTAQGLRRNVIVLEESDVERLVAEAASILGTTAPMTISYTIPVLSVLEASEENLVLVGSGADELFGGYAKYAAMADPSAAMRADLDKMIVETERLKAHARRSGRRLEAPFTGQSMVDFALGVPVGHKLGPDGRKLVLREAAKRLGLEAHDRPKKAAQYSSGVLKAMERMAKREGKTLGEWTAGLAPRASP
ncbi:MAG: asparagine synthase-related protein [Thermoplasmata archaeon]|nr:asparagine synthase-related protein [Thermoplasmata archaeon]